MKDEKTTHKNTRSLLLSFFLILKIEGEIGGALKICD